MSLMEDPTFQPDKLLGSHTLRRFKQRMGAFLIPKLPITRHVFNHFRWEMNAWWVNLNNAVHPFWIRRRKQHTNQGNVSANIGCGPLVKEGWVNLDLAPVPGISFRYDCRKHLPFRAGSVARIRCEHFFEHLDNLEEAPPFLKSCHASLQKGGVLRVVVPDAERYLLAYVSKNKGEWLALGWDIDKMTGTIETPMDILNHVFRQEEEHRYAYDFETLKRALQKSGFEDITKRKFGISVDPKLADDLPVHQAYSLYVEAVKT